MIRLNLDDNELSGEIPPELGALSNLQGLWLYGNDLSGELPPELGNLSNLTWLDICDNLLSGELPPELGAPVQSGIAGSLRQLAGRGVTAGAGQPVIQSGMG